MFRSILMSSIIVIGYSIATVSTADAQSRRKPSSSQTKPDAVKTQRRTQPQQLTRGNNKAVNQLRQVRNRLANAEKLASQKHANAKRTLDRSKGTEQAYRDNHDAAMATALRKISSGTRLERQELARRDPLVRQALAPLRTATVQRANAEMTVNETGSGLREAKRQTSAANRTLSFAKKGDWFNANRVVGRAEPQRPRTQPRKISFAETPLAATPSGAGRTQGILKQSTRNR